MSRSPSKPDGLLAGLPAGDYRRIRGMLQPVVLPAERVLLAPNQPINTLYFLSSGVCSIGRVMKSGRTVEIAMVGNEGVVGIDAIFGTWRVHGGATMRIPDEAALAMDVRALEAEMRAGGAFALLIQSYARSFMYSVMQSAACNAVHSAHERCARWLLTTRDRAGRNDFPFTQASMAAALGVRRPTVTLALAALQRKGLIDYWRHGLVILNPRGLTSVSCECYEVSRRLFR